MFNPLRDMKLTGHGLVTVMCVLAVCLALVGIFGSGELAATVVRALTILFGGCVFVYGLNTYKSGENQQGKDRRE